jgi:hypothetical protein
VGRSHVPRWLIGRVRDHRARRQAVIVKKLGHDFGTVPFGLHQVLAWVRRRRCTCDPRFVGVASAIDCPQHGLVEHLKKSALRRAAH